jgi:hypothetical protein
VPYVGGVRNGFVKEAKYVVIVGGCGVGLGRFVVCLLGCKGGGGVGMGCKGGGGGEGVGARDGA